MDRIPKCSIGKFDFSSLLIYPCKYHRGENKKKGNDEQGVSATYSIVIRNTKDHQEKIKRKKDKPGDQYRFCLGRTGHIIFYFNMLEIVWLFPHFPARFLSVDAFPETAVGI